MVILPAVVVVIVWVCKPAAVDVIVAVDYLAKVQSSVAITRRSCVSANAAPAVLIAVKIRRVWVVRP